MVWTIQGLQMFVQYTIIRGQFNIFDCTPMELYYAEKKVNGFLNHKN